MIETRSMFPIKKITALFSQPRLRGCSAKLLWIIGALWVLLNPASAFLPAQEIVATQQIETLIETRSDVACFVVKHLAEPARASIQVWRSSSSLEESPPMLGATTVEGHELIFKPRFPLRHGAQYVIKIMADPDSKPVSLQIELPAKLEAQSKVVGVFPSADELPENTLKFYVQFSAPMQKGDIYRHVLIREVDGDKVELPFLEIEQEFWSRDSKRLTLLLDPGRIKRGLQPRELMGPILESGKSYELVVKGVWPDANGKPLGEDFIKRFLATDEDHTQPDPAKWKIETPSAGTRDPLTIRFSESLDHAMLFGAINVVDVNANRIEGIVTVYDHEQRWCFQPKVEWKSGSYTITANEDLEDNVGNSIGRPFDVDLFNKTESTDSIPVVELKFQISN